VTEFFGSLAEHETRVGSGQGRRIPRLWLLLTDDE